MHTACSIYTDYTLHAHQHSHRREFRVACVFPLTHTQNGTRLQVVPRSGGFWWFLLGTSKRRQSRVESDDRGITRELVSPSLGETESWIGVVQFVQSQLRDVGLSDSYTYSLLYARTAHGTREVRRPRGSAGALSGEDQSDAGALCGEDQREVVGPG